MRQITGCAARNGGPAVFIEGSYLRLRLDGFISLGVFDWGASVCFARSSPANYWQNWVTQSEIFVATDSSAVVDFSASVSQDTGLDNVTVEAAAPIPAPTPEPSGLLLFGTGLLGMVGAIRKKLIA